MYFKGLFRQYNFVVSQLKHLTPKTTSFEISKMWSTNFLPSKLSEILGNLSIFQFIRSQQNCSNVKYLRQFFRYKEGSLDFQFSFDKLYVIYQLWEIKDDIQVVFQFPCLLFLVLSERKVLIFPGKGIESLPQTQIF